ncbi:Retrovirus-related Pol polyprotein from transposon TNT 1-94 [Operophtera brumata]|uniref:Retrovirus-related Pol polyprotein from transposon TNT 1-94 n=1 Tax=Operophtera brumata TaxID=104452 RepID=A0A0L7L4R6_OPEBR|nr:Retrovirus-related Pol polyprotein from transposon TNT 1-94 [Operophtera brumata]
MATDNVADAAAATPGGLSTSTGGYMIGGFDKLEGISNFQTWKFAMKNYLILEGLWTSVSGDDVDPARSQRALARISLCIKPNLFQLLYGIDTAKDAWNKLSTVYEDKGLFRRVSLLRQLHRVEFAAFTNMTAYIDYVFTLVQQLANIGKLVEDAEIAEILLSGLPQEFDTLVSALETASITSGLSSELVRARLLQEEYRKTNTERNGTGSSLNNAFAANSFKNKKIIRHYCKKQGHIKSKCFKWKRLKKQENAKEEQTMTASPFYASAKTDFIVDSGSTSHMCNNDNLFVDFKSNKVSINCADKTAKLQSSGMGSVQVTINGVTKILKDVMYVPQLSENLLSVSKMCERGLVVVFKKDGCFIYEECTINDAETGSSEPDGELSVEELEAQPASTGETLAQGDGATSTEETYIYSTVITLASISVFLRVGFVLKFVVMCFTLTVHIIMFASSDIFNLYENRGSEEQ